MNSNRSIVCLAALLVALSVFATPPPPALAQSDGPPSAASQLRQLQQYLKELRSRGRSRRWTDTSDLLVKMQQMTGKRMKPEAFKNARTVQDVVDAIDALLKVKD